MKWLFLTTQKEEALSQHAAHAEKNSMKRKIYQQRNTEIQNKTYIWAEVCFVLICDQAFFVFFLRGGLDPLTTQSNHLLGNPPHTLTKHLLGNLTDLRFAFGFCLALKVALNLFTLTFHLNTGQIQWLCCLALTLASSQPCLSHAKSGHDALCMKDYYGISQKFLERRMLWAANFEKIIRV